MCVCVCAGSNKSGHAGNVAMHRLRLWGVFQRTWSAASHLQTGQGLAPLTPQKAWGLINDPPPPPPPPPPRRGKVMNKVTEQTINTESDHKTLCGVRVGGGDASCSAPAAGTVSNLVLHSRNPAGLVWFSSASSLCRRVLLIPSRVDNCFLLFRIKGLNPRVLSISHAAEVNDVTCVCSSWRGPSFAGALRILGNASICNRPLLPAAVLHGLASTVLKKKKITETVFMLLILIVSGWDYI